MIQKQLENLNQQVKNAEQERQKPYPYEAELNEKEARLAFLDADLNMDASYEEREKEQMALDDFVAKERAVSAKAKPSILESLKAAVHGVKDAPDNMPNKSKKTKISM